MQMHGCSVDSEKWKKQGIVGHNNMNLEFSQDLCLEGDMLSSPLARKFYAVISIKGCIQFVYTSL